MKLLLGLLVLAVVAFFVRKAVTKKNAPVKPVGSGGQTTSSGSGSGSGHGGTTNSGSGSGYGTGGIKPIKPIITDIPEFGSGSGSGSGIGSGGSSDGIIKINPGGPVDGSGSGSGSGIGSGGLGYQGYKGPKDLLDESGSNIIIKDAPSDYIKGQLK